VFLPRHPHTPRHLRSLDSRAFGARHSVPVFSVRIVGNPNHSASWSATDFILLVFDWSILCVTVTSSTNLKISILVFRLFIILAHAIGAILSCDDTQGAYDQLLEVVKLRMQMCIPVNVIRAGKCDPDYINPFVEVLLANRNKFRRQGNNAAADKLACTVNNVIANNTRSRRR
jgi:hypothetical protein